MLFTSLSLDTENLNKSCVIGPVLSIGVWVSGKPFSFFFHSNIHVSKQKLDSKLELCLALSSGNQYFNLYFIIIISSFSAFYYYK